MKIWTAAFPSEYKTIILHMYIYTNKQLPFIYDQVKDNETVYLLQLCVFLHSSTPKTTLPDVTTTFNLSKIMSTVLSKAFRTSHSVIFNKNDTINLIVIHNTQAGRGRKSKLALNEGPRCVVGVLVGAQNLAWFKKRKKEKEINGWLLG